jgi:hypothetical protein
VRVVAFEARLFVNDHSQRQGRMVGLSVGFGTLPRCLNTPNCISDPGDVFMQSALLPAEQVEQYYS